MNTICMHFIVSGRVQGVWYRAKTQTKATSLGLTGWVRNLANGNVELVACGPEKSVSELHDWLWHGPELAKVTDVQSEIIPVESFADFCIR